MHWLTALQWLSTLLRCVLPVSVARGNRPPAWQLCGMALWAAGLSGAVEPPALLTLDTACVYLKGGLCGVWRTSREGGGGPLGVKRRKTGGGGRARGEFGEVINIQQLSSAPQKELLPCYPSTTTSPPVCPLHARKQMECERSGRRLQSGFIQLAGLSKWIYPRRQGDNRTGSGPGEQGPRCLYLARSQWTPVKWLSHNDI